MPHRKLYILNLAGLLLLGCGAAMSAREKTQAPQVQQGILDLRTHDPARPVRLDGKWNVYRGRLVPPADITGNTADPPDAEVSIPGPWRSGTEAQDPANWTGLFTFHIKVHLTDREKIYALQTRHIGTAYRIYINERELGGNGVVSTNAAERRDGYGVRFFSFKPETDTIDIIIHTCNFHDAVWGYTRPLVFGEEFAVRLYSLADYSFDFLVSVLLVVLFCLFVLRYIRNREKHHIFLAFTLLAVFIKNLFEDGKILPFFLSLSPFYTHKILYFAYICLAVLMFFYFTAYFDQNPPVKLVIAIKSWGIFLAVFCLAYPIQFSTVILMFYHAFTLVTILYYYYTLFRLQRQKDPRALPFLLGITWLTGCTVLDVVNIFGFSHLRYLSPLGFALFGFFVLLYENSRPARNRRSAPSPENVQALQGKEIQLQQYFASLQLSERESEIAELLMRGYNNRQIGEKKFVSSNTVKFHVKNIFQKAQAQNRMDILHKFLLFLQARSD